MAIRSYRDAATTDIAAGRNTKAARKALPIVLHQIARNRLAYLSAIESLYDLRARPGLNLHALKRERAGEYAIRINDQYRICFEWNGKDAENIQVTDYH